MSSTFIDRLNKMNRGESASIGFTRARADASSRKMRLVGYLKQAGEDMTGVDAGLIEVSGKSPDTAALKKMPSDIPWGVRLKECGPETVPQLKEAGCDFIVFSQDEPLAVGEDKETGKVLEVDTTIPDVMLRSVAELPVDALLVSVGGGDGVSLTWRDLMVVQRFGGIPNKPLMAFVPDTATTHEIEALWQAGVLAVMTEGNAGTLREVIDKADFKASRKRNRTEPVLHRLEDTEPEDLDDEP